MAECTTPWKPDYPSPQKAWAAQRKNPDQVPYRCVAGHWHLTSVERTHNLARGSKAGYRDKWRQRRVRRKLWGAKPKE